MSVTYSMSAASAIGAKSTTEAMNHPYTSHIATIGVRFCDQAATEASDARRSDDGPDNIAAEREMASSFFCCWHEPLFLAFPSGV